MRIHAVLMFLAAGLSFSFSLSAQSPAAQTDTPALGEGAVTPANPANEPVNVAKPDFVEDKHAFGVLPNYRTTEYDQPYSPISTKRKFKIATDDTIDGPS